MLALAIVGVFCMCAIALIVAYMAGRNDGRKQMENETAEHTHKVAHAGGATLGVCKKTSLDK